MLSHALMAQTLPEIEEGIQAVQGWVRAHPDDPNAVDVLEPLVMLWEGFQEEMRQADSESLVAAC